MSGSYFYDDLVTETALTGVAAAVYSAIVGAMCCPSGQMECPACGGTVYFQVYGRPNPVEARCVAGCFYFRT